MKRQIAGVLSRALVPSAASETAVAGPSPALTWERALDAWQVKLQSATTRATYSSAVRAFWRVPGVPDLAALDVEILDAYAGALRLRADKDTPPAQRLAPATVNLKLAALRSFLGFCRRRGWLSPALTGEAIADALQGVRAYVEKPYDIIKGDELGALLDGAAAEAYDPTRALALVALALGAGLRVAELCALDVGDVRHDDTGCFITVREGKGWKDRVVPIAPDVYDVVARYVTDTGRRMRHTADLTTPLLLSRNCLSGSGRLTTRQARRVIVAAAARAGLDPHKRITPHALRHSYALDLLEGDPETGRERAPLPVVSAMLGHSSIAVTGRYLKHFERRDQARYAPALRRRPQAAQ